MRDIAILWDLDGTLLETLEDLKDSVNYTLSHYSCPQRSSEEIRSFLGYGARHLIARALPGLDTDPDVDEALAFYQDYYATHSQVKTAPYPGIPEAMAELGKEFPMAVVSNKPDRAVKPLCRHYFADIYALGELDSCPRKPAPDMLLQAMQDLGVKRCIYVGDSEVDVLTAKNTGVPCLAVLWGFRDEAELRQAGATHICPSTADLPAMLREIADRG